MKPPPLLYRAADSLSQASAWLLEYGDAARVLAGGQSLLPLLTTGQLQASVLVDITRVRELSFVVDDGAETRIGALTTHRQVEHHPEDLGTLEMLRRATRMIGHYPIRTRGTVGGSVVHASSNAEWCVLALLLDAVVEVRSIDAQRSVPAQKWFTAGGERLRIGELVTALRFPWRPTHAELREFSRRHNDPAMAIGAVAYELEAGRITRPRVAIGGMDGLLTRMETAEQLLSGHQPYDAHLWRHLGAHVGRELAAAAPPPSSYLCWLTGNLVRDAGGPTGVSRFAQKGDAVDD